jgi:VWFA-related protein
MTNHFPVKVFLWLFLFSAFIFTESLLSQTKNSTSEQETLQYEVTVTLKLIQIYVIDEEGNPVKDLEKADFDLYDNGKPVKITDFEKHILSIPQKEVQEIKSATPSEIPFPMNRKFFLFFDFAFNDAAGISKAKRAALHFIDTQLHPTDEVGVLSYDAASGITLHEYLTTDHKKIREVVKGFKVRKALGRAQGIETRYWEDRGEGMAAVHEKGLYKLQVRHFCQEIRDMARALRYIPGLKHILFFSSGVANALLYGDHTKFAEWPVKAGDPLLRLMYEKMSEELASSNSPVYAMNTAGLTSAHFRDREMLGDGSLRQLAKLSGGNYFDNIMSYEKTMEEIQNMTSVFYVLGYYIDEKYDGKYHEVKVKVGRQGCKVFGQGGYFNPKPFTEYTKLEKMFHLIDLALSNRPHFQEPFPLPLAALPCSEEEKSNLVLVTKIPTEKMNELLGRRMETVALIFDEQKDIVEMKKEEVDTSDIAQEVIFCYSLFSLPPGEYECRVVARNLETGKSGVGSSRVLIPQRPDSYLLLRPPLLLIPEKEVHYLKIAGNEKKEERNITLSDVYPFPLTQYSPLVQDLDQETEKIFAVVHCIAPGIKKPDIQITASLIQIPSGKKMALLPSVLNQYQDQDTRIFLIELPTHELKPGKYSLYLSAEETSTKSRSHVTTPFLVK